MAKSFVADPELSQQLEQLKKTHGESVKVADIGEVVQSVMASMQGDISARDIELYSELEGLAQFIHAAKTEIAALNPDDVKHELIATAGDELDAIVAATAEATNKIMDATEVVETVLANVDGENAELLTDATTQIYEACSFQDITGQRITKVVKALQGIEAKVDGLVMAFGDELAKYKKDHHEQKANDKPKGQSDEDLLNGPQLEGDGKSQAEIDALLASFD